MKAKLLVVLLAALPAAAHAQEVQEAVEEAGTAGALAAPSGELVPDAPTTAPVPEPAAEVAPVALVPPPAVEEAGSALLEAWLERRASDESSMRVTSGVTALLAGVGLAVLSTWLLADETLASAGYGRVAVGATGIAVSAIVLGIATFQLVVPSPAESRWARFASGPRDPRELARFAGELRGDAEAARRARFAVLTLGVSSLALSLGFVITTAALDASLTEPDRIFGYGMGGMLGALGLALAILSIFDSPAESAWRSVEAGTPPRAQVRVAPWASAHGGGLVLAGSL